MVSCRDEVRKGILEAAMRRFKHYGYKKTTIDEIAQDCSIGKGTVYLHFECKEDVLLACVEEIANGLVSALNCVRSSDITVTEKLKETQRLRILSFHDFARSATHGLDLLAMNTPKCKEHVKRQREIVTNAIAEMITEGNDQGVFDIKDPETAAILFFEAFNSFLPPFHGNKTSEQLMEMVDGMAELFFQGMLNR